MNVLNVGLGNGDSSLYIVGSKDQKVTVTSGKGTHGTGTEGPSIYTDGYRENCHTIIWAGCVSPVPGSHMPVSGSR